MRLENIGVATCQKIIISCMFRGVPKTVDDKKRIVDTYRTRTCAGEPKRFLVFRLNHSAKVSYIQIVFICYYIAI